ncbi:MAG: hypothetical protein ABI703_07275 [Gemmatimonadales bacterium]
MARNVFGLALLAALALSGCSQLDNLPFLGNKKAKAAEAQAAALRARTDSLRKVRRIADSLAQVRYVSCVDSVRTELVKPPVAVVKRTKASRKQKPPAPSSEELIAAQAQQVCGADSQAPLKTVASDSAKLPAPVTAVASASKPDSVTPTATPALDQAALDSVQKSKETEMYRETFAYSGSIRDPFNSLLNMAKAGPEIADLQLVGIYQNMRVPSGSVAVFREREGGKRHKLRAGDQLGRSRVVQIRERDVVFMIEDFGFERQETLSLRKQEDGTP